MKGVQQLASFCVLLVLLVSCYAQKSVDAVAQEGGCETYAVVGLSQQLVDEMNCMVPGVLTSFANAHGIVIGDSVFPYLQAPATNKLIQAVAAAKTTLYVNSALRTLPQQYLLYRWNQLGLCGITAAAPPGLSNHNKGLAIDIESHATWVSLLNPYGFTWFGNADVVHFTYGGSGTVDLNSVATQAFQQLWNLNNPNDQVVVDGIYGPATEARVQRSPSTGFPLGSTCASTNSTRKRTTTCTVNGVAGTCINSSDCTGTSTAGHCPGAADIECCTGSQQETTSQCTVTLSGSAISGNCIDSSTCTGQSYSGYCPGPSNIKCCIIGGPTPSGGAHTTDLAGVQLIESFEGFYANFYTDPVGIKTIGYGHACHVSDCSNLQAKNSAGTFYEVYAPLSRQAAEDLLRADLENGGYESCVNQHATISTLSNNQFSALVSFTFNLGCGALTSSTLLKLVNQGVTGSAITTAFQSWDKAGGQVLSGLLRRRTAEATLFNTPDSSKRNNERNIDTDGVGAECWHYGQKGVCQYTAYCQGANSFYVAGLCPGPANVQCCLRPQCTANTPNDGSCALASECAGTVYPVSPQHPNATCFGATDLQCCVGTVPEPTTQCPDGSTWSTTNRWCQTNDSMYALGPFTKAMINQCYATGGDDATCGTQYPFMWAGQQIYLMKWPMTFALRIRGTADCLLGSTPNNNYLGYCMELLSVPGPVVNGTATTIVTQVYVYGAMEPELQQNCQAFGGGIACITPRWGGDFFKSVAQPPFLALQITNNTVTAEDSAGLDTSDTMSNSWVPTQVALSLSHETAILTVTGTPGPTSKPSMPTATPAPAHSTAASVTLAVASLCVLFLSVL